MALASVTMAVRMYLKRSLNLNVSKPEEFATKVECFSFLWSDLSIFWEPLCYRRRPWELQAVSPLTPLLQLLAYISSTAQWGSEAGKNTECKGRGMTTVTDKFKCNMYTVDNTNRQDLLWTLQQSWTWGQLCCWLGLDEKVQQKLNILTLEL